VQQFGAALAAQLICCHHRRFTVLTFQDFFSEHVIHHMLKGARHQDKEH